MRRLGMIGSTTGAAAFAVVLLMSMTGCSGCSSTQVYPANLTFPPRADRLVLKLPEKPPVKLNTGGELDREIAGLDDIGGRTVDPASLPAEAKAALDSFLQETFGTPAAPTDIAPSLNLTQAHLTEGSRLFKRHCLDCHNLNGDGRGQKSGVFLVPAPRDYRQGAFKFITSGEGMKPRRSDLLQTIHHGLKGTAMPAFSLLQDGERDLLAGYVMYLAIRGQVEFDSLRAISEGKIAEPAALLNAIIAEWEKAEAAPSIPTPPADGEPGSPAFEEAVRRGHKLFIKKIEGVKSCLDCHGDYGRKPELQYEIWGTVSKPANFTEAAFKGGSRPEDIYARIRFGIPAVGMPAHGSPQFSERDVWDLVRFVNSAPYMNRLPPDVRSVLYPNP